MMNEAGYTLSTSITLDLEPRSAFEILAGELRTALHLRGMRFEPGSKGEVIQDGFVVAQVLDWLPGDRITLHWKPASWEPAQSAEVDLRFLPAEGGTKIQFELRQWGRQLGDPSEVEGWFATEILGGALQSISPKGLGDWITDRRARRPSGASSRAVYRDPLYHYPSFRVIIAELALGKDDYLLDVGCGGGAFIKEALRSGCKAEAVDHSPEMVELASEVNSDAIKAGRLKIHEARAERLPFADATFTRASMTGVLGFLPDPVAALSEIQRVLRKGGKLVLQGTDPEIRGTPAAPEPMASRLRFTETNDLESMGRSAGFGIVQVLRKDLGPFAREAGIPDEHLPLFEGSKARFLIATKD